MQVKILQNVPLTLDLHQTTVFVLSILRGPFTPVLLYQLGKDVRKLVFRVSDKVRLKPACLATDIS